MHWIDPKELQAWADLYEAQSELPALIRRLVLNTVGRPQGVDIPSGSSVTTGGWDGTLKSDGGSVIPAGKVAFEFSTGADIVRKANENYAKRTNDPLGAVPCETTFMFVTPRVWTTKAGWERDRATEGHWKDVRAIDATGLAQWIDASPVVGSYLARKIGKTPPAGFIALTDFWDEWSKTTNPAISSSLLTGGRLKHLDELSEWASRPATSFFVQGETKDDAIAFLAGWAARIDKLGPSILARALVVTTQDAWLDLSRRKNPLVLIPKIEQEFAPSVATGNGHHVLIPLERGDRLTGSGCVIPRQGREEFVAALTEMGLEEHHARALANSTGRHLPTVRRRMIDHAGGPRPAWAQDAMATALVPAVLLGQWTESEGDVAALTALGNADAKNILGEYQSLLQRPDAPMRRIGDHWHLVSHEEAWELLSRFVSRTAAENFRTLAADVLAEVSPAFELEPEERHLAGLYKASLSRSEPLRAGMVSTLALMATRAPSSSLDLTPIPRSVIREVFGLRGTDWKFWATASSELTILAEADPGAFLNAVESGLTSAPNPFVELFNQEGRGILGGCYHDGLLFGLERVAMSEEYFSRAAIVLARLAAIDPGGKYANRPLASLSGLFLDWIHFTDASDAERLQVLDVICNRVPDVGWKLLIAVAPGGRQLVTERERAAFRDWGQNIAGAVTIAERADFGRQLLTRLTHQVGTDADRWSDLIGTIDVLVDEERDAIISLLDAATIARDDTSNWDAVRVALRDILHRHRVVPDARWAMAPWLADRVEAIYLRLHPSDAVLANAWLFDYWPNLPDGSRLTDIASAGRIDALQREAFAQIHATEGRTGIERLIEHSIDARKTGEIAGKHFADQLDIRQLIRDNLERSRSPLTAFAEGAMSAVFRDGGWSALEQFLETARAEAIGPEGLALVYLSAGLGSESWKRLECELLDAQRSYWSRLNVLALVPVSDAEYEYAIQRLLDYGRAPDVVDAMAYGRDSIPTDLMLRAIELTPAAVIEQKAGGRRISVSSHDIARVFSKLEEAGVDDARLARLEVPFAGILHHDRPQLALHRVVTADPGAFADLVTWAFKRSDAAFDPEVLADEERRSRGQTAWSILHHVSALPGRLRNGDFDGDRQLEWVREAKRLCAERGRDIAGRRTIGQVLACAPAGADGVWPHESVRRTLDELNDRDIGIGFVGRKQNLRGVTWRGMTTGGQPERQLAAAYREDAVKLRSEFPFTASLLQDLATAYESEAIHHDHDAEWMDR